MKNDKKHKNIIKAKNYIVNFCVSQHSLLFYEDVPILLNKCSNRILKKYVKHILVCGDFYNELFIMPTKEYCLENKIRKNAKFFLLCEDDF